jgi:hypothetical protein
MREFLDNDVRYPQRNIVGSYEIIFYVDVNALRMDDDWLAVLVT